MEDEGRDISAQRRYGGTSFTFSLERIYFAV